MSKSANSEYVQWMNKVQSKVTIRMSPTAAEFQAARAEYKALTGTDNMYEHDDIWKGIINRYYTEQVLENISLNQAQTLVEPMRIAHPDQYVSLYTSDKSFIGNTTWNDQMEMFWEYPTFTPEGAALAAARKAECDALGKIAAYE